MESGSGAWLYSDVTESGCPDQTETTEMGHSEVSVPSKRRNIHLV